jgi:hypothetical protein
MSARRPTLPEPITIEQWWKNRGGEVVRLELSTYQGHNILNLRTWRADKGDGIMRPGKGFACSTKHLRKLAAVFAKAVDRAKELGLLDDEGGEA